MKGNSSECEIKLELTDALYSDILSQTLKSGSPVRQRNFFFDSKDKRLGHERWALRLRQEDSIFQLTAKGPSQKREGGIYVRTEIESEVPSATASAMLKGFYLEDCPFPPCPNLKEAFGNLQVTCFLDFSNTRVRVQWKSYILELDETQIAGQLFYELELEAKAEQMDQAQRELRTWFEIHHWPYIPSKVSKLERALGLSRG